VPKVKAACSGVKNSVLREDFLLFISALKRVKALIVL
jgi:hypothetical protein